MHGSSVHRKKIATTGTGQMLYFTSIEIKMKRSKMSISPHPKMLSLVTSLAILRHTFTAVPGSFMHDKWPA